MQEQTNTASPGTRNTDSLPDIIHQSKAEANTASQAHLKWVGMEKIGLPVRYELTDSTIASSTANVDIFVSLDNSDKGIHMSRLYLNLNEIVANQALSAERLNSLLDNVLETHKGISNSAKVRLEFELAINKKALLSQNAGYQSYPVVINHEKSHDKTQTTLELTIPYSSTCPCSTALANQLISEAISEQFPGEELSKEDLFSWLNSGKAQLATPHNQRSYAYLKLDFADNDWPQLDDLIFALESAIGTPVQTAVKREDEQEFARLNGSNPMFCEDAARKVKGFLETQQNIFDYWFKVEHQESLHAHNAVVVDFK